MEHLVRKKRKRVLLTTVPMPAISFVNQIPGRKISPRDLDTIEDCLLLANNESYLGGRFQPSIGLRFLKENIPSVDILEFPQWGEYKEALKQGYDAVGISFYTTHFYDATLMANMAREAGVKEVWAGNYGALTPSTDQVFDRLFLGCAERELKQTIEGGTIERIRHPIITTPFKSVLSPEKEAGYLFTNRGCRFKCQFCCSPIFSPRVDAISMDEIQRVLGVYKEMGIEYIIIGDETFMQYRGRALEVIDMLHRMEMRWFCTTRADLLEGHVKMLHRNGFDSVYMGVESMNNGNLKSQQKGQPVERIIAVVHELKQSGISTSGTYILGLPDDTIPSIKEDLERLKDLALDIVIFLIMTPYPELPIYRELKSREQIIDENWRHYDGMHMVFRHPNITPVEAGEVLSYAIRNVYGPYSLNKRRVLMQIGRLASAR